MIDLKKYSITEIYSLFFQNICDCKIDIDLYLGIFYITIHIIYIILIIYNIIFTHNLIYTFILLIILFMNTIVVLVLRACPIVLFEKKYINTTYLKSIFFSKKEKFIKKNKVLSKYLDYELDEITLQGLATSGIIVSVKLLVLFIFN